VFFLKKNSTYYVGTRETTWNVNIITEYSQNCHVIEENADQCGHSQMKEIQRKKSDYFFKEYIAHCVQKCL
jgi:hypothetical protein